jgi:putative serine protease PepD
MSDTEGTRPDDSTPEFPAAADGSAPQAEQTVDAPAAQQAEQTVDAPAAPQQGFPPPPQTPAWQAPQGVRPAGPAAGQQPYPPQTPPYGPPRVPSYAGQQAPAGAYAGQQAPGQPYAGAFGPAGARPDMNQTQPTVPFGPMATGSVPTAPAVKKKSGAGKVAGLIVAAALVGGAAGLGGAYAGVNLFAPAGSLPAAGPATVTVNNTDSVNQTTAIAGKVLPSVVTISATSANGAGTGSGVVLTSDGYVVTNTHVVTLDGASADAVIRVTTSDGRVYDAEVVGTDPTYDLAVIKLADAEGLTPVEFADSSDLNVGDQTIALGAPLGLSNTVTTGIVSALNRSIQIASAAAPESGDAQDGQSEAPDEGQTPEDGQTPPFFFDFGEGDGQQRTPSGLISIAVIQTDAAINPGNSGGALVDADGRLIGVNVAIATAGGMSGEAGSIGVGFAIPSNIVQRVTDEIIETGAATHGLLGASVQDAANVKDSTITGAYIAEVVADGAALEAGLQEGDIVTAFNGVPITDATDLTAQVRAVAAGSDATVTYVRDGETRTVDVTLGELPL